MPDGELDLGDDGEPMLTSTVGRTDSSDHGVVPMFALHTRLGPSDPFRHVRWISGLHLTLGLTAKVDSDTEVEYLVEAAGNGGLRSAGRPPLPPHEMRRLLIETGTPQTDGPDGPASELIGPLPNLAAALEALDL